MAPLRHVLGSRLRLHVPSQNRHLVAIGLLAVLVATRSYDAQVRPQFRGGTHVTRVIVRVLDKNRRPVRDLKAADFTVLVNGEIRKIDAVVAEDAEGPLSPSAPWMRDIAPDVATNDLENPRLFVLILDDVAFGGIPRGDPWALRETKAIAASIVDGLGPKDLVAVVFTGDNRQPQDFTSDRARIRSAIERFHDIMVPPRLGEKYRLATLSAAIGFLKTVPDKRSAIFWITSPLGKGSYTPTKAPLPGNQSASVGEADEQLTLHQRLSLLLDEANLARIPVYPINNTGLPGYKMLRSGTIVEPGFAASDFLLEIARATGGRAIVNTNSPRAAVPAIFAELSLHYIVGYESGPPSLDGRFQKVQILVNRKGVTVEPSELSYFNATPRSAERLIPRGTADATSVAMSGIIPVSDERLRLIAMPLGPDATRPGLAAVGFALGVIVPRADGFEPGDVLETELRIFDGEGRREIEVHREAADVPASANQATDFAIDLLSQTSLKPGRYNIRASVHSTMRNRSGSVYTDVVVPDFRKAPLSVSAVLLATANSRAVPPGLLSKQVPVVPTTLRTLTRGQKTTAYVRVFSAGNRRASTVSVHVTIRDSLDRVVFDQTNDLALQDLEPAIRSAEYTFILPSAALTPGEYLLTMSVTSSPRDVVRRDVRFTVN